VHSTKTQPYDIWAGTLNYGEGDVAWKRITRLNPVIEETFQLSESKRIRYKSVDGWEIDAVFIAPTQKKGEGLPPLYVDVHGGPSWADQDSWMITPQILAAAGYAILQPNMRGSWGRGVAFADAVLGDMGGKDFQDILHGIDYVVEQGWVDGNRVAIGGWSNGGFLSAWAVTQTDRFKAAMVGAGITDWHNMHAQTNIADADMRLLKADPLENPEAYHRNSPITFARRVTTPTLIIHGENDPAVPVAQAYEFYRALCERNVPVECVIYPREGHGLSEREHIEDYTKRLLAWLERYV
jgi:dipeptidyl aminopeptidase/acylaminoacyl peptidase